MAFQFLGTVTLVAIFLPDKWVVEIWRGEGRPLLLLAFVAAFMQGTVWPIASQMAEAQRETISVQRLNTLVVLVHLGVVLVLWCAGQLAIPLLFGAMALEWAVGGWLAARMYRGYTEESGSSPSGDTPGSVLLEFWRYCGPYLPYTALGFAHDFADRWMLQNWGGASEQAYYAVAQQYAGIALLATTSVLRIFWKEIAEAHHRGDLNQMEHLYSKASRGLFFVGALTTGGLLPWASEIIRLSLGAAYSGGSVALMLMFLYPVHQSLGQISGSMLLATAKARIYVILGVVFMTLSLIVAYVMMAPVDAVIPGLNLAAEGLAWKMVTLQILSVNLQAWFIARTFGWKFDWTYQLVGLALAVSIGWLAKAFVTSFLEMSTLPSMLLAATIYLVLMLGTLSRFPWIAGMERNDLMMLYKK
ncbi:MAG: hypothetical protein IPO13_08650 [Rhodocyclaceae bacterium]|nr:hypothetical protein [Rhodocyclaceae bacterium]